jgi:ABC-type transport system involved in cytochrome c biogenesis permease subunit
MGRNANIIIYVIVMVATVVAVDIPFFRHRFLDRLIVNIGIVLVYIAFYLRFLKHP